MTTKTIYPRRIRDAIKSARTPAARPRRGTHPNTVPRRIKHQTLPTLVEFFDPPFRSCPMCGATAITMLPPVLASQQEDGTTAVCHPSYGGCNHGFSLEVKP